MKALIAHDVVRVRGGRRVLDGLSLTAAPGRRIGLIGENGAGKTTLLRVLAGVDEPDAGTIERPAAVGYFHQELPFGPNATVAAVLDDALREAREAVAELDRLAAAVATDDDAALLTAYAEKLEEAQHQDVWDADRRALAVLAGLGLAGLDHRRPLAELSGGQRGRLALAALLVRRPAALLLDEPTNHLDDAAAAFCEEHLRGMPGVVVVASHDREFLDSVCTDVIDMDPAIDGPVRYGGGYTAYLREKRAEAARWRRRWEEEQEQLGELRAAAAVTGHHVAHGRAPRDSEKMGYGHTAGRVQNQISRRVRAATRRLDLLEHTQVPPPPEPLRFRAPALTASDRDGVLVELHDVTVPRRLRLAELTVTANDRLLLTGPNGAGKSTLLAVLAGRLPAEGTVQRRPGLRIGLLTQDTTWAEPGLTARETFNRTVGLARAEATPLASLGLLGPADVDRPVGELSVGQSRRLALAVLVADPPELLVLDEPTNHLSPLLCDELEEALGTGPGAVVVASHDRRLRQRWPGREVALPTRNTPG
ncbi:ABC-F family ATP-binding cassette domain-containing protein [Micromonospora sp. CPCC 206060]|uniref:ABC-F family ATP-binding cassette domain-containing protein n=1 Tax=Micromonospora sp. CPCC 206060 TaxID=3122406 RepID=UPI002FF408D8